MQKYIFFANHHKKNANTNKMRIFEIANQREMVC